MSCWESSSDFLYSMVFFLTFFVYYFLNLSSLAIITRPGAETYKLIHTAYKFSPCEAALARTYIWLCFWSALESKYSILLWYDTYIDRLKFETYISNSKHFQQHTFATANIFSIYDFSVHPLVGLYLMNIQYPAFVCGTDF